jgi:hypothetical protein
MVENQVNPNVERENKRMSDAELVAYCKHEAASGITGDDSQDTEISLSLDYFYARKPGLTCKDPNASTTVSTDVQDAVLGTIAQIMPAFSGQSLCSFEPLNGDDEDQAKMESDLVNYVFFEQCDGFTVIVQALMDALLHRVCTASVHWDKHYEVTYQKYTGVTEMMLPQLMQPSGPEEKIEVVEWEEVNPLPMQDRYGRQMMIPAINLTVKRISVASGPVVIPVPPEHAVVSSDQDTNSLDKSRFAGRRFLATESELIQKGYDPDLVKGLPGYSSLNYEGQSRARKSSENDHHSTHSPTRLIEAYEVYPLVDRDGDGIAERMRVVYAHNSLLEAEPYDSVALKSGTGILMAHRWQGISLFDRLKQIQDSKTKMSRTIEDGTSLAARQRHGVVDNMVNIDDLLSSETGGIVRMRDSRGYVPFSTAEVPQSAYQFLEWQDKKRREAGGGAADNSGQRVPVGQAGDFGIDRIMSAMELDNAQVGKTFSETFLRSVFLELHSLIRKFHQGEITAKIGDRWVSSTPQQWPPRNRVGISIGTSQGERQRQASALNGLYQTQVAMRDQGSTLVNDKTIFQCVSDMTHLLGLRNPEQYWVDPNSPEGIQATQNAQAMAQKAQQKQEAMEQFQMQIAGTQAKAQDKVANAEMGKAMVSQENNRLKHQIDQLNARIDAMEKQDKQDLAWQQFAHDRSLDWGQLAKDITELEITAGQDVSDQTAENMARLN